MKKDDKRRQNGESSSSFDSCDYSKLHNDIDLFKKEIDVVMTEFQKALKAVEDLYHSELKVDYKELRRLISSSWEEIEKYSYEWAKYGWTIIGRAPPGLYRTFPKSIEEADKMAFQYVEDGMVESLISQIKKLREDMAEIDSASFCYQNEHYLACCMIILALIERVLVKSEINQQKKVGLGAINLLENSIKSKQRLEETRLLMVINTFEYLKMLFENADNFKVQPKSLNRNFIVHGMFERNITKNDCIKLFLGLFNVVKCYDRFIVQESS